MNEHQETRRRLHIALYVMLLASAACTLLFTKQLWEGFGAGNLPLLAPLLAPLAFVAFLAIYTADRWILIRKHRYPVPRAAIQVAMALVFLTWLAESQTNQFQLASEQQAKPTATSSLFKHREARVRAATCELMALKGEEKAYERIEGLALGDRSEQVRNRCTQALETLKAQVTPSAVVPTPTDSNQ